MGDICNKIRFSLSYQSGELRFSDFDIIKAPEYSKLAGKLRTILLDQPLACINVDDILKITCPILIRGSCLSRGQLRMLASLHTSPVKF